MRSASIPLLFMLVLLLSCDNSVQERVTKSYTFTVGDSTITITAEAVDLAGSRLEPNHFNWDAYMLREFQVATNAAYRAPDPVFPGTINEWKGRPWIERRTFLLEPYTRDINTNDDDEYYYLIGTFIEQFGYGWTDTFDPDANLWNPAVHPWSQPADTTLDADDTGTIEFDGASALVEEYRAMWVFEE